MDDSRELGIVGDCYLVALRDRLWPKESGEKWLPAEEIEILEVQGSHIRFMHVYGGGVDWLPQGDIMRIAHLGRAVERAAADRAARAKWLAGADTRPAEEESDGSH